jgi:glyoxylase-like metal-dependent hydrolase (beta-lactamase superfamily II)
VERTESPPFGIHRIDSGYLRAQMDAIHLIVQDGRAAIVESGTTHAVPQVLAALSRVGLTPEAVDWVMLTHIHLDHAGGAGALLQALPRAHLLVHPRGVRHMCEPSRLWAASAAVYGEAFVAREYGQPVPVAVERITEANEGRVVMLGGRPIEVAETPGHARHHVCYWDAVSRGWFTGDAFGLSYRETHVGDRAFVVPATTPSQFEPDAMHSSIERLLAKQPERMFLTHYGEVGRGTAAGGRPPPLD